MIYTSALIHHPFFFGKILNTGGVSAVFCLASYLYFLLMWFQEMLEDLTVTFNLVYCFNWPLWLLAAPLSIWKTYNNITDFWFDAYSVPDTVLNILNDYLISYLRFILVTNLKYRSKFYPHLRGMKHLGNFAKFAKLRGSLVLENICVHPLASPLPPPTNEKETELWVLESLK